MIVVKIFLTALVVLLLLCGLPFKERYTEIVTRAISFCLLVMGLSVIASYWIYL